MLKPSSTQTPKSSTTPTPYLRTASACHITTSFDALNRLHGQVPGLLPSVTWCGVWYCNLSSSSLLYHWYRIHICMLKFSNTRYPETEPTFQNRCRKMHLNLKYTALAKPRSLWSISHIPFIIVILCVWLSCQRFFNFPHPFPHKLWHLALMIQDDQTLAWNKPNPNSDTGMFI